MADPLMTIEQGVGADVVRRMIDVWFPDAMTILDATHSKGEFWRGQERRVIGMDLDPAVRTDVRADFMRMPFRADAFDLVVFDPPYITNPSKAGTSRMAQRFGAYPSLAAMQASVMAGAREAWRVARLGVLVKVQDQIRSARWVEMTEWVRQAIGQPPYQRVDARRPTPKIFGENWTDQLSAYGNGATFLCFRKGSQYHRRRD